MAEQPISGEQIIQQDWAANATKSANDLDQVLQKLIQHTGILASNSQKVFPQSDPKSVAELTAQNKAIEESIVLSKQQLILKETEKNVRKENAAILKQEAIQLNSAKGSIASLRAELSLVTIAWKNATAAERGDINVTGSLAQQKLILTNALKKLEAATGDNRREVGNYHGAVGNLAKGLGGLTGIVALAGSALGINTEALITLKDTTKELIKFSRDLTHIKHLEAIGEAEATVAHEAGAVATTVETAAVERATIAQRAWNLVMSINPIALLVTAVALLTAAIYQFVTAEDAATIATREHNIELYNQIEAQKALNKIVDDANKVNRDSDKSNLEAQLKYLQSTGAGLEEIQKKKQEIFDFDKASLELQIKENTKLLLLLNAQYDVEPDAVKRNQLQAEINKLDADNTKLLTQQNNLYAEQSQITSDYYKEKKKQIEDDLKLNDKILDNLLAQVHTAKELKKIADDAAHDAAQSRTDRENLITVTDNEAEAVHKLSTEYDRLNKEKGQFVGQEMAAGVAGTKKEQDAQNKIDAQKLENAKRLNDAIFKLSEDRIKAEQNLNKQQLSQIDTQLQQQFELLKAGQANTYDFMLKQKAAALEEQAKLDKKARKEKEAEQLVNIFLEFLKADIAAGGGKNGFGAAAKALAQTALAKGLAEGLSGFYEGTEDTGSGGGLDSKGGMLAVLHPHERVLTAKQNAMIGSLSNDELVNSIFKYNVGERKGDLKDSGNEILIQEVQELNRTIKNKKELQVDWNRLNEIILTEKANGLTTETTYKNSPIIHRQKPFSRN